MSDRIETGWLYDFYGPLLTERQQKLLSLYCNEDFSLSEIAAREGISRQGVYDAVHRAERQLEAYEKQLGLLARYRSMTQGLEESLNVLEGAEGEKARRARGRALRPGKRADAARKGDSGAAAFTRGGVRWPLKD